MGYIPMRHDRLEDANSHPINSSTQFPRFLMLALLVEYIFLTTFYGLYKPKATTIYSFTLLAKSIINGTNSDFSDRL